MKKPHLRAGHQGGEHVSSCDNCQKPFKVGQGIFRYCELQFDNDFHFCSARCVTKYFTDEIIVVPCPGMDPKKKTKWCTLLP